MQRTKNSGRSLATGFMALTLLFTILSTLFVLLRSYVRIISKRNYGWDDGVIVVALVLSFVSAVFISLAVSAGYGKHFSSLSEAHLIKSTKWFSLSIPICVSSLAVSKISICLFLLRLISKATARPEHVFLYSTIAVMAVNAVTMVGYSLGQCHPVQKQWDQALPGHCHKPVLYNHATVANGAINAIGDFALALFPTLILKDLKLQLRKKITLACLMGFGIVCGALAVARTILSAKIAHHSDDIYHSVGLGILGKTEEHLSIIVACVPTLKPAFDEVYTRVASYRKFSIASDRITPLETVASPKRHPSSQESESANESLKRAHGILESSAKNDYTVSEHREEGSHEGYSCEAGRGPLLGP